MGFKSKNTLVKGVPTKVNTPSTSSKQKAKIVTGKQFYLIF